MGPTLIVADQMSAYVLADRGTFLKFSSKIGLVSLFRSPEELANPYGILVVNPDKDPAIQAKWADAFVDFLVSERAQRIIQAYTIEGEQLFYPMHLPAKDAST